MKFKRLTLSGLMMTVMSMTAHAAGSAPVQQLDMKASLSAQTCTIADLNKTFVLPDVVLGKYKGVREWYTTSGAPGLDTLFSVRNCPAAVNKVSVKSNFSSADPGGGTRVRFIENTGTAVGFAFDTGKDSSGTYIPNEQWEPGVAKEFTLTNGAVDVPFSGVLSRDGNVAEHMTTGTLNFDVSMVFDFL